MKEEKRNKCQRLIRKLIDKMLPFTSEKEYTPMNASLEWLRDLIVELHDKDREYDLPKSTKIECNKLWKECIMRDNY